MPWQDEGWSCGYFCYEISGKAKQMKILTGLESSKWIKWHAKDEMKFHYDDRESYIQKYFYHIMVIYG